MGGSITVELIILDCTVSFDTRGKGTAPTPQMVRTGQTATEPALQFCDDTDGKGYYLEGWYTDEDYTAPYDFATVVDHNFTLYANWEEAGHFTLTANAGGTVTLTDAKGHNLTASGLFVPGQCTLTVTPASGYKFTGTYAQPDRSTGAGIMQQTIDSSTKTFNLATNDLVVNVTFSETYKVFVTPTTIGNATEGTFTLKDGANHSYMGDVNGEELAKVNDGSEEFWSSDFNLTLTVNNTDATTAYAATVTNKDKMTYIHDGMRSYTFTPMGNVNIHLYFYKNTVVDVPFTDNSADNGGGLQIVNAELPHTVELLGRTFYKDGKWNTLCLPFALTTLTGTPLEGATVMQLNTTSKNKDIYHTRFDEESGTLNLYFKSVSSYQNGQSVTSIEAGQPYIVKWATTGAPITNPKFFGVFITNKTPASVTSNDGKISFCGTYDALTYDSENRSILFLGGANTLYFPQPAGEQNPTIGACRAYFQLNGITSGDPSGGVKNFVLDFDGDIPGQTDGIAEQPTLNSKLSTLNSSWYDLSGRKISDTSSIIHHPSSLKKGLYIHNGRKVVVIK